MIDAVLDASAVLAYLRGEPGGDAVEPRLARSMLSAVNAAEVVTKLIERGSEPTAAVQTAEALGCEIVAVDGELGLRSGALWSLTRARGLSLGDRVCLALAEREGLPVLTADSAWKDLPLAIEVSLIR